MVTSPEVFSEAPGRSTEVEPQGRFSTAGNWDDMERIVEKLGSLRGNNRSYSAEELKRQIALARTAADPEALIVKTMTRAEGFRDKAIELIEQSKQKKK